LASSNAALEEIKPRLDLVMTDNCNYIVITPVKDEGLHIERTLHSMVQQTILPSRWIIVDDGSRDQTRAIIERFSEKFHWITLLCLPVRNERQPGSAVIHAFAKGFELIGDTKYDYVVKMDADLDLPSDYFEQLLVRFREDKSLGIASGEYLEEKQGQWIPCKMPSYHASGASKMVRAQCFADIGGFVPYRGWDTIDEIRAEMKGWKTRHFSELQFYHLKPEGSGIGFVRTSMMHGEIYYLTGGGGFFLFLKFLHRLLFGKPFIIGGLMLVAGFLKAKLSQKPRLATDAEARSYRALLNRRLIQNLAGLGAWVRGKGLYN